MTRLPVVLLVCAAMFSLLAVACAEGEGEREQTYEPPPPPSPPPPPPPGPLAMDTTALPAATVETGYNFSLKASGGSGTYSWSLVGGVFPNGVSMNSEGRISGMPRVTGTWPVRIELRDGVSVINRLLALNVNTTLGDPGLEAQLQPILQNLNLIGLGPQHMPQLNPAQVDLGRLLFFEPELSGPRNISCATCHHPTFNTGDGLNLSVGVGGLGGVGPGREHPLDVFVHRHAQPLYNLGLVHELFWDKRVVGRPPNAPPGPTITPEGMVDLPPLDAQALMPLVSIVEMRGAGHALDGFTDDEYREKLVERLMQHPGYVTRFEAAFGPNQMTVENMGRAIAAFQRSLTFINSPWDRYMRGNTNALTDQQKRGAILFFDRGACAQCHAGPLLSNLSSHNVGVPQFGPGMGDGPSGREDFGVEHATGDPLDRYAFRVPPLRNIAFTAPYMHNGAFETLEEVLLHYRDKAAHTNSYTGTHMVQGDELAPTLLPTTDLLQNLSPPFLFVPDNFTQQELADLKAFLEALTDPQAINRTQDVPQVVPSGLPVE